MIYEEFLIDFKEALFAELEVRGIHLWTSLHLHSILDKGGASNDPYQETIPELEEWRGILSLLVEECIERRADEIEMDFIELYYCGENISFQNYLTSAPMSDMFFASIVFEMQSSVSSSQEIFASHQGYFPIYEYQEIIRRELTHLYYEYIENRGWVDFTFDHADDEAISSLWIEEYLAQRSGQLHDTIESILPVHTQGLFEEVQRQGSGSFDIDPSMIYTAIIPDSWKEMKKAMFQHTTRYKVREQLRGMEKNTTKVLGNVRKKFWKQSKTKQKE